ncbi:Carboxylesterase type B [Penicillium concentricum]|uniref:Carboxylesterase type B n=1 Tax=Penicillium concentricum TaxID=293559 RepID=A0A9W9R8P1_9EURO|nr:Carboxylesterase type B [Penicillium concentricum]KAJ5355651.1 Carboxylesterase type B [Penicillium concentricum]
MISNFVLVCLLSSQCLAERHPLVASLGGLRVLHYNNLGPQNNGTSAVLAHDHSTYVDAAAKCTALGEKLFPWSWRRNTTHTELDYELDYLAFTNELGANDHLWLSTEQEDGKGCFALSISHRKVVQKSCKEELPALCTSTPPKTTDLDNAARETTKLTVTSDDYTLTGYRDARSFRFLGVPFASPPIDDLRFAPPRPYTGSKNIDATSMADSCIQSTSSLSTLPIGGMSENCLYLNVFTPFLPHNITTNTALRPVAVYIYGGSFTRGTAAMVDYDGGNFASRSDVVVVTLNYRLGALGFLSTGNLTTGSYGIQDQIMALQWVQKHISALGGDPSHVTVFGQSSGGQSVVALLSSTAAKGLLSGALVQSANFDLPWFPRALYSKYIAPEVGKAVGCDGNASEAGLLRCLRSVPASMYLDNSTAFETAAKTFSSSIANHFHHSTALRSAAEPFMPMVDDTGSGVIDDQFNTLLANNKLPIHVPTMFTTVRDEAGLYMDIFSLIKGPLATLLNVTLGDTLAQKVISSDTYNANNSDRNAVLNAVSDALTHSQWVCPQGYLLDNSNSAFPSLYEIQIADGHAQTSHMPDICYPNNVYNASCHTSENLLAWGTLNMKTEDVRPYYDDRDILHSQLIHDVFGAFFRERNPNPDLEFLKARGPAYASTLSIFGGEVGSNSLLERAARGLVIEQYASERNMTLLGMPPSTTVNFRDKDICPVVREYGFTFQRAALSD